MHPMARLFACVVAVCVASWVLVLLLCAYSFWMSPLRPHQILFSLASATLAGFLVRAGFARAEDRSRFYWTGGILAILLLVAGFESRAEQNLVKPQDTEKASQLMKSCVPGDLILDYGTDPTIPEPQVFAVASRQIVANDQFLSVYGFNIGPLRATLSASGLAGHRLEVIRHEDARWKELVLRAIIGKELKTGHE